MQTLPDLRGSIPSILHTTDGTVPDINTLDLLAPDPGVTNVRNRAGTLVACPDSISQCLFSHPSQEEPPALTSRFRADRAPGIIADQTVALDGASAQPSIASPCQHATAWEGVQRIPADGGG